MSVSMEKSSGTKSLAGVYAPPRVNLLPPEILAERRLRRTQAGLAAVVLATTGAVVVGFVVATASAGAAQSDLDTANATTTTLLAEQTKYAEVPQVLAQVDAAQAARATAMQTDVLWYDYLSHMAASYPKDIWLDDVTMTASAPAAAAVVDPTGLTHPGVATITINGTARRHSDVADWLDVLTATPGFDDATYSVAVREDIDTTALVAFTSTVTVTEDALSHRFENEDS